MVSGKSLCAFEVPICMVFFECVLHKNLYGDWILLVVFFIGLLVVGGVVVANNWFQSACALCLDSRLVCLEGICAVIQWLDPESEFQSISRAGGAAGLVLLTVKMPPLAPSKTLWLDLVGAAGVEI